MIRLMSSVLIEAQGFWLLKPRNRVFSVWHPGRLVARDAFCDYVNPASGWKTPKKLLSEAIPKDAALKSRRRKTGLRQKRSPVILYSFAHLTA